MGLLIDYGVYTSFTVDLTNFDFTGISGVVMTVKNKLDGPVLFERRFTSAGAYQVTITPDESRMLNTAHAVYDFNVEMPDGIRYKNGENGQITIRRGVGQCL